MIIFHENNKNIPAKSIWAPWYACCFCTYFLKKEPWEQGKLVSNIFQKMGKNHTTIVTFLYKDISNFAKKERINHESTRKSTSKIIFFEKKMTINVWVFAIQLISKKKTKSRYYHGLFCVKYQKYDEKNHVTSVFWT